MSILHTISKPPSSQLLAQCLSAASKGDAILFLEDGVYYCAADKIDSSIPELSLFGLREDITARGIQDRVSADIRPVTMRNFVELCCEHDKVVNWF